MARKSKSSAAWLREKSTDPYSRLSQAQGARARSRYKLAQINHQERFLRSGCAVVDLGAAPGGWSLEAKQEVGPTGTVIAVDRLAMDAIPGVEVLCGDFTLPGIQQAITALLPGARADVVLSDMAPNMSGIRSRDQALAMALAEAALWFADEVLQPGGVFLVKVFQGEGVDAFRKELENRFEKVKVQKPDASMDRSREFYLFARGFAD